MWWKKEMIKNKIKNRKIKKKLNIECDGWIIYYRYEKWCRRVRGRKKIEKLKNKNVIKYNVVWMNFIKK